MNSATVEIKTMPAKVAPMMLHEEVATGSYNGKDFQVVRDLTGLHWHIRLGETIATFRLNELIQSVVEGVADATSTE